MSVIGIDPSLTAFSWTHLEKGNVEARETVKVSAKNYPKDAKGRVDRYRQIIKSVVRYSADVEPDIIVIENYSFGSRGQGVTKLGELGGILRDRLFLSSEIIIEVAPPSLKKFAAGKGNARKGRVIKHLEERYGQKFFCDDEADAFCLAKIGECLIGLAMPQTSTEGAVLGVIRKSIKEISHAFANIETIRIYNTLR